MNPLESYRQAQDGMDAVLAAVPADRWDARSACAAWSVVDVAGHVTWGQHQMRAWATGEEYANGDGAPGAPHPATMTGDDPVATWRAAREASVATLSEEALTRITSIPGIGEVPLVAVVTLLTVDTVVHTWDIAHAVGGDSKLHPGLVTMAFDWARTTPLLRQPEFFAPELTPPTDADEQTRLLAYLGRAAWK